MVEELLEPFIGEVNTQLFETIVLRLLNSEVQILCKIIIIIPYKFNLIFILKHRNNIFF